MNIKIRNSKKWPTISIVTPSFNQSGFLESTIKSVLSQNYPNLEYIVIDGGSTDGSVEILKKYDKYLHYWCSEPDQGQYHALSKGFSKATGEIMAWINSDDMYYSWAFETVADIMYELPEIEWLTTLNPGVCDWNGFVSHSCSVAGYSSEAFLDGRYAPWGKRKKYSLGWLQQESMFWKRSLWIRSKSKVCRELEMAGDFELWSRFFNLTTLYATSSPLGRFRHQENQKTCKLKEYTKEADSILLDSRQKNNWSYSIAIRLIKDRIVRKNKVFNKIFSSRFGYSGYRIVRSKADTPNGCWKIEKYKF